LYSLIPICFFLVLCMVAWKNVHRISYFPLPWKDFIPKNCVLAPVLNFNCDFTLTFFHSVAFQMLLSFSLVCHLLFRWHGPPPPRPALRGPPAFPAPPPSMRQPYARGTAAFQPPPLLRVAPLSARRGQAPAAGCGQAPPLASAWAGCSSAP